MPYGKTSAEWNALAPDERAKLSSGGGGTASIQGNRALARTGRPGQFSTSGAYQVLGGAGDTYAPGAGGGAGASGSGGGLDSGGIADFAKGFADAFGGGAGGASGSGGAGGAGNFSIPAPGNLSLTAERSPDLEKAQADYEARRADLAAKSAKVDSNLQFQIDEYKKRLGEGPTTRSIERAASAIRDQAAGMSSDAATAGAAGGRGSGFQAAGIGEGAQRALAGASADITLGRQKQLDDLVLGGSEIMGAPGKRELAYDTLGSDLFSRNPYGASADYGLAEKKLGLDAYLGQGDLGIRAAAAKAQQYGSPLDWFRMLYGA
jgi:hypothetical protein